MRSVRTAFILLATIESFLSCEGEVGVQGPTGPAGSVGAQGPTGAAGPPGSTLSDCPDGYVRDASAAGITLCKQGRDEIVKVGTGRSAFWVDRYEASVWSSAEGTGTQYGVNADDYPGTFPDNGQATVPLYAVSKVDTIPSSSITWFQASKACRASGKRLMTAEEWFAAIEGTPDPAAPSGGGSGACVTQGALRPTGSGSNCRSVWGAEDMVGNQPEMTAEWFVGVAPAAVKTNPWPAAGYGTDAVDNVDSAAISPGGTIRGAPSIAIRGGGYYNGTDSGIFTFNVNVGPAYSFNNYGFRCVTPR